jgi:hypothetical protein
MPLRAPTKATHRSIDAMINNTGFAILKTRKLGPRHIAAETPNLTPGPNAADRNVTITSLLRNESPINSPNIFNARQWPGKSASLSGNSLSPARTGVERQCMWVGKHAQASMWNDARARTCRTASRNASICVTSNSDRRSSRFAVKKNVPPGTRLRRYPARRSIRGIGERRKALRFSALRVLKRRFFDV